MEQFLRRILTLIQAVFGQFNYAPPPWMRQLQRRLQPVWFWVSSNRKRSALIGVGAVAVVLGGYLGWDQYQKYLDSLPKPDYVTVHVSAPSEPDLETGKPRDLRVVFSRSAAPIDALDKPVRDGISLKPEAKGSWRWSSDRELQFTPEGEHWQVGQKYTIRLARKLVPDHVLLKELEYTFEVPKLTAYTTKREFYQDPKDPNIKRVVWNLEYNYALDTEDFKKRVRMTLQSKDESVLGTRPREIPFTVSFGKRQNEVFLLSDVLPIPKENSVVKVVIDKGVRSVHGGPTEAKLESSIAVPGLFERFKFTDTRVTFARNEKFEPEQILILNSGAEIASELLAKHLKLFLLPKHKAGEEKRKTPSHWASPSEITADVRARLEPVNFTVVPSEQEHALVHTFKIDVPVGRYVYVQVPKGLKSFGGYELLNAYETLVRFPEYPRELLIMSEGSLLSLSGDKKIPLLGRNVNEVKFKLYRILPTQLNQFVYNNYRWGGSFSQPSFDSVSTDTLSEVFQEKIKVPFTSPAATQYFSLDLGPFLAKGSGGRRGLFYIQVESGEQSDRRLIVLTDLGTVVKRANDGSYSVFVQNLRTGQPVAGASVEVMGTNGIAVLSQMTGPTGRADFPDLKDFKDEKKPLAFVVEKDGDLSFLPYEMENRALAYSRFDVSGLHDRAEPDQLTAFLFSDRGIYRPGDQVHLGMMVRSRNSKKIFNKVPIQWAVTDARGNEVHREKMEVASGDLASLSVQTQDGWPTGTYSINVFLVKKERADEQIGSLTVRVEEFLPDRMRISAQIDGAKPQGWVSPTGLSSRVSLKNLFGTPAENRRVTGELVITPVQPYFKAFKDYAFAPPNKDEKAFTDSLNPVTTNERGEAVFALDLSRFTGAVYTLRVDHEGFEAQGGRAVAASSSALVSAFSHLIGVKSDGLSSYLNKDADHSVELIAINSDLKKVAVKGLKAVLLERRYVSALMQQNDGTYKYQSVPKEITVEDKPLEIPESGLKYKLPTATPGEFVLVVKSEAGAELNRIGFQVAGVANLSRSMEKSAELQVVLNKSDFNPGDEIEMQIKAPYTGAGLITIERDRVFASQWFKTSTTSTVQRIRIPEGLQGNAYVNVTFLRAPDSREIFMSPLSYAVQPFSISLAQHKIALNLEAPAVVKPGETLNIAYSADRKTKLILYGVDEGILSVSRYRLPDPLNFFFQRRALQVKTFQLLDLLLPEYSVIQQLSAPGGDEEGFGRLARNLNPFKRKTEKPVVFWSGVIEAGPQKKTFTFEVPDYFNGSLKVMAVATSGTGYGSGEQPVVSRGDFVISSNVPTFVAPGDEFELGLGVSNQAEGSGAGAQVKVEVEAPAFEVLNGGTQTLAIAEGREGAASVRLRAKAQLGSQPIRIRASAAGKSAKASVETSIRPVMPYATLLTGGRVTKSPFEVPVTRQLLPEFRKHTLTLGPVPLVFGRGLKEFLDAYPYGCTEQLISKAFPYVLLKARPEFQVDGKQAAEFFAKIVSVLRTRQTSDGGFAMYDPGQGVYLPVTLFATHLLLEARERGFNVPEDVLSKALTYLEREEVRRTGSLAEARGFAYALYLRARAGKAAGGDLSFLRKALEKNFSKTWDQDLAAAYIGATLKLLKEDEAARTLFKRLKVGLATESQYEVFYDSFVRDTAILYLAAKHLPDIYRTLATDQAMNAAFEPLARQHYTTHSAAHALLALDAMFTNASSAASLNQVSVTEIQAKGATQPLSPPAGTVMPSVDVSALAEVLKLTVPTSVPYYYMHMQAGFDRELPKSEMKKGLDVRRDYLDKDGNPVTRVKMGQEVVVRLRVRSLDQKYISYVVLVDLLPSGLEPVLEEVTTASTEPMPVDGEGYEGEGFEGEPGEDDRGEESTEEGAFHIFWRKLIPEAVAQTTTSQVQTLIPQHVERREDRMVIYAHVTGDVHEFRYRAKAIAQGSFVVPPAFAEAMYDRDVQYRGLTGAFTVDAP